MTEHPHQSGPDAWRPFFAEGMNLIARQDYQRALSQLSHALVEAPEGELAQCYAARGYAYLCLEEYERTIEDCNLAIEHDPAEGEAYAWRGSARAGLRQWRQMLEDYRTAMDLMPDKADEYEQVVLEYLADAMAEFNAALREGDATAGLLQDRGAAYAFAHDYHNAVQDFSQALRLDPHDILSYAKRADCYAQLGEFEKVLADCTAAVKLGCQTREIFYRRGNALRRQGRQDLAIAEYTRALRIDANYTTAFYERALAHVERSDHPAALQDLSSAIGLDASVPDYYRLRGEQRVVLGQFAEAVSDFSRVVELAAKSSSVLVQRGEAYNELEETDLALADFDEAIRLDAICAPAFLGRGQALAATGEYARALAELNKALRLDTRYVAAYEARGDVRLQLEQYAEAVQDFSRVLEIQPEAEHSAWTYYRRGVGYSHLDENEQALADFDKAVSQDPSNPLAYVGRGSARAELGAYREALDDILAAIELSPDDEPTYRELAEPWCRDAVASYDRAISENSRDPQLYRERARTHEFLRDLGAAYRDYTAVIGLDPDDRQSYVCRAHILREKGNYQAAIANYDRAIELGDDQAWTYYGRGFCFRRTRQPEKALEDVEVALAKRPGDAKIHLLRGQIYVVLGMVGRAEADFARAIDGDPDEAAAFFGRGTVYAAVDRLDRAVEDFTAALERDPASALTFCRRGEVYLRAKKIGEAIADFDSAIRLAPDLALAYCNRALALARAGRSQEALIELTKLGARAQQGASFAVAFDVRARIWYGMGQYRKAIVDYGRVIELRPEGHDFARTLYGRGLAYAQLDDFERAERCFLTATEIQPKFEPARKLLAWVRSDRSKTLPELRKPAKVLAQRTPPISGPRVSLDLHDGGAWSVPPMWDQWLVRSSQQVECGPVAKLELDLWCRQGRLDNETHLLRVDWDEWLPAGQVYPELVLETHRSANRPMPLPQVAEVETADADTALVETVDEPLGEDSGAFEFLGPKKRGQRTPPDEDVEFPGIKV